MTASGGLIAAVGERRLGRLGGLDLVAGAAQARPQRPEDLRLVVDDEHASRAVHEPPLTWFRPACLESTRANGEHEGRALARA